MRAVAVPLMRELYECQARGIRTRTPYVRNHRRLQNSIWASTVGVEVISNSGNRKQQCTRLKMKRQEYTHRIGKFLKCGTIALCFVSANAYGQEAPSKENIEKLVSSGIKSISTYDLKTYIGTCRKTKKDSYRCRVCKASVMIKSHGTFNAHYSSNGNLVAAKIIRQPRDGQEFKLVGARQVKKINIKGQSYKVTRKENAKYNWDEFTVKNHDGPKIFERAKLWCKNNTK